MFYCQECDTIFEHPYIYKEDPSPSGVALPSGYYIYELCPFCQSPYIDEIDEDKYEEDDL